MMRKDELIEALRDRDNARHKNAVLWCLAIIGAIWYKIARNRSIKASDKEETDVSV